MKAALTAFLAFVVLSISVANLAALAVQPQLVRSEPKQLPIVVPPFGSNFYYEAMAAYAVYVKPIYASASFCYSWGYEPYEFYWVWTGNPNPDWLLVVYEVTFVYR